MVALKRHDKEDLEEWFRMSIFSYSGYHNVLMMWKEEYKTRRHCSFLSANMRDISIIKTMRVVYIATYMKE